MNIIKEGFNEINTTPINIIQLLLLIVVVYIIYKISSYKNKTNTNIKLENGKDSYIFSSNILKYIFIALLVINFIIFIIYNITYVSDVNINYMEDNMNITEEQKQEIERLKKNKYIANIFESINYYSTLSLLLFIIISTLLTNKNELVDSFYNYINNLNIKKNKKILSASAN